MHGAHLLETYCLGGMRKILCDFGDLTENLSMDPTSCHLIEIKEQGSSGGPVSCT